MSSDVPSVRLPLDSNNNALQLLTPPHQGGASAVTNATLNTTLASAIPGGASVVEIGATEDAYILFGESGDVVSTTTGFFLPKGAVVYRVPESSTHVIHVSNGTAGRITITKLV
jgi:hypothetical protein